MASYFDPAKTAGTLTLSGGNLIVTAPNSGSNYAYSFGYYGASSGQFYAELTSNLDTNPSNYNLAWGIAKVYTSVVSMGNDATNSGGFWIDAGDVNFYQNGNTPTSLGISNSAAGVVVGMAVDLTNQLIWYRINGGNWNGNASYNPATGIGGVSIAPTLSGNPVVWPSACLINSSNAQATVNFGSTSYQSSAPAGFQNWGAGAASIVLGAAQRLRVMFIDR